MLRWARVSDEHCGESGGSDPAKSPCGTFARTLNLCDDNNPGEEVEEFTLEDSMEEVLQGQTGIEISFYETQEDADNATNPITSPYTNTSNAQTIYIRGENEITSNYFIGDGLCPGCTSQNKT